jgi:hypothetical protein
MRSNPAGCVSVVFTACIMLLCCPLQEDNTTYLFYYDNLAGNGRVEFQTNPEGTITRTELVRY